MVADPKKWMGQKLNLSEFKSELNLMNKLIPPVYIFPHSDTFTSLLRKNSKKKLRIGNAYALSPPHLPSATLLSAKVL